MASSMTSLCSQTPPIHSIKLGFHQNPNLLLNSSFNLNPISIFRFKNASKLLTRRRLPVIRAGNQPSDEPLGSTEAVTSSETSTAEGPPFLTILAGIVVFGFILWVLGSIVSWLIGLVGLVFSK